LIHTVIYIVKMQTVETICDRLIIQEQVNPKDRNFYLCIINDLLQFNYKCSAHYIDAAVIDEDAWKVIEGELNFRIYEETCIHGKNRMLNAIIENIHTELGHIIIPKPDIPLCHTYSDYRPYGNRLIVTLLDRTDYPMPTLTTVPYTVEGVRQIIKGELDTNCISPTADYIDAMFSLLFHVLYVENYWPLKDIREQHERIRQFLTDKYPKFRNQIRYQITMEEKVVDNCKTVDICKKHTSDITRISTIMASAIAAMLAYIVTMILMSLI
jgi:hypothetical protein